MVKLTRMMRFKQWVGMAMLATLLGVFVMETFHGHHNLQFPTSDCSVCKIAQQPVSLTDKPETPEPELVATRTQTLHIPQPYLLFVFESHGLSPPAL